MRRLILATILLALAIAVAVAFWLATRSGDYPSPARAGGEPQASAQDSVLVTPVAVPLGNLADDLAQTIPASLWSIDQQLADCVPQKQLGGIGSQVLRTPKIGCRLVGEAKRGRLSLGSRAGALVLRMPVTAQIEARNIGGVVERKTATARAMVTLTARLEVDEDWRLRPDIDIAYRWTQEPGTDFLGARIRLTKLIEKDLRKAVADAERQLEEQLAEINLRAKVERFWQQGHANVPIHQGSPPVWLRVVPSGVGVGAVRASGNELIVEVMLQSATEVFVGEAPAVPEAAPLGNNLKIERDRGMHVSLPVLATYSELENPALRRLRRMAEEGLVIEGLGRLDVEFEGVTIYATDGGRVAVGITAIAEPVGQRTGRIWGRSRGEVWLIGTPRAEPDSKLVNVSGLQVYGDTDSSVGDLLVMLIGSKEVTSSIEQSLAQDFGEDYDRMVEFARDGLREVQLGEIELSVDIAEIGHGQIEASGAGLYMPLEVHGSVETRYRPD